MGGGRHEDGVNKLEEKRREGGMEGFRKVEQLFVHPVLRKYVVKK